MHGIDEIIIMNDKAAEKELRDRKEKTELQNRIEKHLFNIRNEMDDGGNDIIIIKEDNNNDDKVIITINDDNSFNIVMSEIDNVIHDVISQLISKQIIDVR